MKTEIPRLHLVFWDNFNPAINSIRKAFIISSYIYIYIYIYI
jgi:hypothetical protein